MDRIEKYILMYKDYEVLTFTVDFSSFRFEVVDKLERFDLAPYGMDEKTENLGYVLSNFFNRRTISVNRWDHNLILQNTHCSNSLELSFKGHGLSLSNHYWFKKSGEQLKYDEINFFSNKWDDSFAKAVLSGDYESLSKCDLNVPDIVTPGWAVKGWLYEDGPKLYKLAIHKDHYEEPISEVLASRLAQRLFKKGEALEYELVKLGDKYASKSSSMLSVDEELVPLSRVLPREFARLYYYKNKEKDKGEIFYKRLKEEYPPEYYLLFVKIAVLRSLCFVSDLHFENISVIKNIKTGEIRPAPLYDLGGSFGSSRTGKDILSKINKGSYFIVYYLFSGLDPQWDYSWYDPSKLEGFEDEIREYLSKSSFYTPEIIEKIIGVYQFQKETLEEIINDSVAH